MPWHIEMRDGKHCVIKDADGSTEKCHPTMAAARAHMAALYANVEKAMTPDEMRSHLADEHGKTVSADMPPAMMTNMHDRMHATMKISKVDEAQQNVFGWANVAFTVDGEQVVDLQEHVIDLEDLEYAAYGFVVEYRASGEMHEGDAVGILIESMLVTPEKLEKLGLARDALPVGWWVGFHFEDRAVFDKVRDGTYKMFSIQGRAIKKEV